MKDETNMSYKEKIQAAMDAVSSCMLGVVLGTLAKGDAAAVCTQEQLDLRTAHGIPKDRASAWDALCLSVAEDARFEAWTDPVRAGARMAHLAMYDIVYTLVEYTDALEILNRRIREVSEATEGAP